MIKATLELTDDQLLDVIQFVKEKGITAVFDGALLLEVGKKYRNRKGEEVLIEGEEYGLIEEVEEELPFEMVVGGVYKDRNGRVEKIVEEDNSKILQFKGESGLRYTKQGDEDALFQSPYDLIKRIK